MHALSVHPRSIPQTPQSEATSLAEFPKLVFKESLCTNKHLAQPHVDGLKNRTLDDKTVARIIRQAYEKGGLNFLNKEVKNLSGAINEHVEEILREQGLVLFRFEDSTVGVGEADPRRGAAIDSALPTICQDVRKIIKSYEMQPLKLDAVEKMRLNAYRFDGGDLSEKNLTGTDFRYMYLSRVNFTKSTLVGANFRDAIYWHADFSHADLSGANLTISFPLHSNAYLSTCKLVGVNLSGANLTKLFLNRIELPGVNLKEANLSRTVLDYANLQDADLSGTKLDKARFYCANLNGVNFTDADFTGVIDILSSLERGVNLDQSIKLRGKTMRLGEAVAILKKEKAVATLRHDTSCVTM